MSVKKALWGTCMRVWLNLIQTIKLSVLVRVVFYRVPGTQGISKSWVPSQFYRVPCNFNIAKRFALLNAYLMLNLGKVYFKTQPCVVLNYFISVWQTFSFFVILHFFIFFEVWWLARRAIEASSFINLMLYSCSKQKVM